MTISARDWLKHMKCAFEATEEYDIFSEDVTNEFELHTMSYSWMCGPTLVKYLTKLLEGVSQFMSLVRIVLMWIIEYFEIFSDLTFSCQYCWTIFLDAIYVAASQLIDIDHDIFLIYFQTLLNGCNGRYLRFCIKSLYFTESKYGKHDLKTMLTNIEYTYSSSPFWARFCQIIQSSAR